VQAERALRRLEGVTTVRVTLEQEAAYVSLKTGALFEPGKFRAAIKSASQEVRNFELRLRAAVERQDGRYYLRPSRVAQRFAVGESALTGKLDAFVGKQVRARGTIVSDGPPLELELLELLPP